MIETDILSRLSFFSKSGKTDTLPYSRAVFALGTFDGVHVAHRELLKKAGKLKKKTGADALAVWCFSESPARLLGRQNSESLTEKDEKVRLLLEYGADIVVMADFEDFRNLSAEDFINDILRSSLFCIGTVCGFNHRFGKDGAGDSELLRKVFGRDKAVTVPKITLDGVTVCSSAIRSLVSAGKIEEANRMLGRAMSLTAEVKSGKRLGRTLGFPTANQVFPRNFVRLKHGVYATRCHVGKDIYFGVSNVGVRPSIDEGDDHIINCETYLIGFSGELYGQVITVEFCEYLREEMRFPSLDALSSAIKKDSEKVIEYFNGKTK